MENNAHFCLHLSLERHLFFLFIVRTRLKRRQDLKMNRPNQQIVQTNMQSPKSIKRHSLQANMKSNDILRYINLIYNVKRLMQVSTCLRFKTLTNCIFIIFVDNDISLCVLLTFLQVLKMNLY
jgi:hypothetical protein